MTTNKMERIKYLWKLVRLEVWKMKFVDFSRRKPLFRHNLSRSQTFKEQLGSLCNDKILKYLNLLIINPENKRKVYWDIFLMFVFMISITIELLHMAYAF